MTMIGTPPNVIIATLRAEYTGEAFGLFDFAAVGVGLSLAGVACLLLFARVVPLRKPPGGEPLLFRVADYLFEVKVQDRSGGAPLTVGALRKLGTPEDPIEVHAIDRGGLVFTATSDSQPLFPGDVVQLEGRAPVIEQAIKRHNLTLAGDAEDDKLEAALTECVVTRRSRLIGDRAPLSSLRAAGAALLAISRNNRPQIKKLQQTVLRTGDIVLLQVAADKRSDVLQSFGLLPLADRALELVSTKVDWRPVGMLAAAIVASALQWTSLSIALMAAIAALVLTTRRGDRLYSDIDWSIIVMLAAIIPVANAFTALGGGDAAATWLAGIGVGQDRAAMIALVLGLTMAVTPFLNNAAAVLVMAPIAAQIGTTTGYGIDAMLMAVAVGASCDFLTPIGHQSNTLVMGPGGYRFLDYARLGLPLSVLVLVLGTALIDNVW
jgi:di/tricarboxylate transporter